MAVIKVMRTTSFNKHIMPQLTYLAQSGHGSVQSTIWDIIYSAFGGNTRKLKARYRARQDSVSKSYIQIHLDDIFYSKYRIKYRMDEVEKAIFDYFNC